MLLVIKQVLDARLQEVQALLKTGEFVDGQIPFSGYANLASQI